MKTLIAGGLIAALITASPAGCERPAKTEPSSSTAPAVPAPVIPQKAPLDESCLGQYHDVRIVGRILDDKGKPQGSKPMRMIALNMQGIGQITDATGIHVDEGYSALVNSTYVMCLVVERKMGDAFTYHVRLRFRIQTNANGWSVQCSVYDPAVGRGAFDLGLQTATIHTSGGKVVAAEVTCERKFP